MTTTVLVKEVTCDNGMCPKGAMMAAAAAQQPSSSLRPAMGPKAVSMGALPPKMTEGTEEEYDEPTEFSESTSRTASVEFSSDSRSASVSNLTDPILAPVILRDPLLSNRDFLGKIGLRELNCQFDTVTKSDEKQNLRSVVRDQALLHSTDVTILFAIRYPACPSCREHGKQIAEFAATDRKVSLIGCVKGGAGAYLQKAVLEFYQNMFQRNTLYMDDNWQIGKATGGAKLSIVSVLRNYMKSQKRWKKYGVMPQGPLVFNSNEVRKMGGMFVFDRQGALRFHLPETFAEEIDVEMIAAAVKETRRMERRERRRSMQ